MNNIIKNADELGVSPLRQDALTVAEAGLQAIDTKNVLKNALRIDGDVLEVDGQSYNLGDFEHIYIIGFGKVSCTAAHELEKIFKGRVRDGAVIGVSDRICQVVDTYVGTHPLPSSMNYNATKHIEEVARSATERDLVLVVVSGGGSALLCSSMGECEQGTALFAKFLQSGGTIEELNIVRKHISHLKGGGLAKVLYPATVLGLVFSDVPGGDVAAVASGPTCFDETTQEDAQALIDKYDLGEFFLNETPKDKKYFEKVHNVTVVSNMTALTAMEKTASELGYNTEIVSASEYNTVDETIARLKENLQLGSMRCMGGETKMIIPAGCKGKGGRNDGLALCAIDHIGPGEILISLASDGHDNTEAAGALVDTLTKTKAKEKGIDHRESIECFDSYPFFKAVGDHIHTGLLESNVSDIMFTMKQKKVSQEALIDAIEVEVIDDSRKKPTIRVTLTAGEHRGVFSVPSGASTGEHEVHVLPAEKAAAIVEQSVLPALKGVVVTDQQRIDDILCELGGDSALSDIGGNVALGVSVAAARAAASSLDLESWEYVSQLFGGKQQAVAPRLVVNLINGGAHAVTGSEFQEHQIIPDTDDVSAAVAAARVVQDTLREILEAKYGEENIGIGDEGGFVIPSQEVTEPFAHIVQALEKAEVPMQVIMGADIAATSFCENDTYTFEDTDHSLPELLSVYQSLHQTFPLLQAVEDPCAEHDFAAFAAYHDAHPEVLTIGDDLTTTNKERLQKAITKNAINGIIIKPNQIGTLSDTLATMSLAYEHDIKCIVSHRSGETMDDFIADLAFGTKCFGLKAGAPSMPERAAKYDRLISIQESV